MKAQSLGTELSKNIASPDLIGKENQNFNLLLKLFNKGVSSVQPSNILNNFLVAKNKKIIIKEKRKETTYRNIKNLYVLCIGKASVDMAVSIKNILSKSSLKIKKGILVVNKENFKKINGFKCFSAGHPVPNNNGLIAARFIKKTVKNLFSNDLVIVLISGGGSALLPLPVSNISLKDKIETNKVLLESGANIKEINSIRKHLSQIKGGNLVKLCFPAKVHGLILSDVIGDDLGSIASGMTTHDNSSFSDVLKILKKYKIWKKIPLKVQRYITIGIKNSDLETPKKNNQIFKNVNNTLIGSNSICLSNIQNFCKSKQLNSKILFKNIDMDVKKYSEFFVSKIKNIKTKKPLLLLAGGETTVKIKGKGKGGRNQEFALHFLREMKKTLPQINYLLLSAGTDGKDGPTNAAGGIVGNNSLELIKKNKIDLIKELKRNNSYEVLKKIDSLVIIKSTNTNVADIQILLLK